MAELPVEPPVKVIRSQRRTRTVSAYRQGGQLVVLVPARLSRAEEAHWVARMAERMAARERRSRLNDDELLDRAAELSDGYLGGRARPNAVWWVDNQQARWGSCTPADATIRLSRRLLGMPEWVIDYVLLHELAHLLEEGHGPAFWLLLAGYPKLEQARGFLEGVAFSTRAAPEAG